MRFDEVELEAVPLDAVESAPEAASDTAPWFRRLLALLTDLSLFAALTLALLPLLPAERSWMAIAALAGFVVVMSFYYFAGAWMLWGRTIGGAIFDVKIVPHEGDAMSLRITSLRWLALMFSLMLAGVPLLFRAPDRISGTHPIAS